MKKYNIILVLTIILFFGCKNEKIEYKYAKNKKLTNCSYQNDKLIKEAVYTFEAFISDKYTFLGSSKAEGYHNYLKLLFDDRSPASEFFNPHLNKVVSVLQDEPNLWISNNNQTRLNYKNDFVVCLIASIKDSEIKNILTALTSSNTLKPSTLAPSLYRKKELLHDKDRALATYVALDMFYSKLIDMSKPGYVEKERNTIIEDLNPENSKILEISPEKIELNKNK